MYRDRHNVITIELIEINNYEASTEQNILLRNYNALIWCNNVEEGGKVECEVLTMIDI